MSQQFSSTSNSSMGMSADSSAFSSVSNTTNGSSAATSTTSSYVALGDSVAAGLGLPQSSDATAQDVQCGRSPLAYPNLVAARLGLPLTNLACQGATVGDLFTEQHMSGPNPPAQLSNAFANGSPQLMTITAGANDAHWASFLRTCYVSDCATNATTLTANTYLTLLKGKLALAMQDIQARSGNNRPEVVITGYYNPISANCVSSQITPSEITWLTNETTALNQVIQAAASHYSFATFVPINFTGHDLCSNNPWIQGLNDPAPFHPTTEGQQAVADAILESPTVQTFNR